jgi:hypothetical protein
MVMAFQSAHQHLTVLVVNDDAEHAATDTGLANPSTFELWVRELPP